MSEPAKKKAAYEDLYTIADNMTGEIIDGKLIATPRPSRKHTYATSALGSKLIGSYQFGENGGPGGWVIIVEPEIKLGENIMVPDLAGWKEERYPEEEPFNSISAAPDWVCEMLSPGTRRLDRMKKMPIYAHHKVAFLWLVDPIEKTLEVFGLEEGSYVVAGLFTDEAKVRAEPFAELEMKLNDLGREARRAP